MHRVYFVLLPLYRQQEMDREIEDEWILDSHGLPSLSYHLFAKLLFRIAHYWATNVDVAEYVELLEKLFNRITLRKVTRAVDGSEVLCYPTIFCEILPEAGFGEEDPFNMGAMKSETALLERCFDDEQEIDAFEYVYVEDPQTLTLEKCKRRKTEHNHQDSLQDATPLFSVKDHVIFNETAVFYQNNGDFKPASNDFVSHVLADMNCLVPIGYPTEQFLTWMKNDVADRFEASRKARKEALARMKREAMESGGTVKDSSLKKEEDDGLLQAHGKVVYKDFPIRTNAPQKHLVRARARLTDILYNSLRYTMKDTQSLSLRLFLASFKTELKATSNKRSSLSANEPAVELNKFGYNPALVRRVQYKDAPVFSQGSQIRSLNINYMMDILDYQAAYRCDVERVENSEKLAIKPQEEFERDEDFSAVNTSYKRLREIMLQKKFESLYTESLNAEEADTNRRERAVEKELERKRALKKVEAITTKGVTEKFEEKSLIKMVKGPFYKHVSSKGIARDDFVISGFQDLIDAANQEAPRIFVIGKPRSGKSTLSKMLAQKLSLLHINVENWLNALIEKIKNHDPAEDEVEEGEPPKKWLSDLEEQVQATLLEGSGPSLETSIAILKEQLHSPAARLKGFILDLHYFPKEN
jgi:hypothetical protein